MTSRNFMKSCVTLSVGTLCFLVVPLTGEEPAVAPELKSLIEKVKAQEATYASYEMVLTETYEHMRLGDADPADLPKLVSKSKTEWRIVRQNDCEYVSRIEKGICGDGHKIDKRDVSAYDGKETRSWVNGDMKVYEGLKKSNLLLRPQMLLLEGTMPGRMSLAEFLEQKRTDQGVNVIVTVEGNEKIGGLDCVKVKVEFWRGEEDDPSEWRRVWLAKNRNDLPVMSDAGFEAPWVEEATVLKWSEIVPGVWMPKKIEIIVNETNQAAPGKQVPRTRRQFHIEKIDLKPNYPVEFFQKISPPDQKPE